MLILILFIACYSRLFGFFHNFILYVSGLVIFITFYLYLIPYTSLVYSGLTALLSHKFFISNQVKNLVFIYIYQISLPKTLHQVTFGLSCTRNLSPCITNPTYGQITGLTFPYKRCYLSVTPCILLVLKDTTLRSGKGVIYRKIKFLSYMYANNCSHIPRITYYLI